MDRELARTKRTIAIIKRGGRILLKGTGGAEGWYLHAHTNIAAGFDRVVWGRKREALPICNLQWAYTIAPLYKAKVVVMYPKGK